MLYQYSQTMTDVSGGYSYVYDLRGRLRTKTAPATETGRFL